MKKVNYKFLPKEVALGDEYELNQHLASYLEENRVVFADSDRVQELHEDIDFEKTTEFVLARQYPPMLVRDEIVMLLNAVSEIEHSLMVQYLFMAFSLPKREFSKWRFLLVQIAREEMGHFLSMQNLLVALGAPVSMEREDQAYNQFYPFPFELCPFSLAAVARFVLAEMPAREDIPADINVDIDEVMVDAGIRNSWQAVNRVGAMFDKLIDLFDLLDPEEIAANGHREQADPRIWGAGRHNMVVEKVTDIASAKELLKEIGEQGEGYSESPNRKSHFSILVGIYHELKQELAENPEKQIIHKVPSNPTVRNNSTEGSTSNVSAHIWGEIFNQQYRWVLSSVSNYFALTDTNEQIDTVRWAIQDMKALTQIADHLVTLELHPNDSNDDRVFAGPFELPYSIAMPTDKLGCLRHQKLLAEYCLFLLAKEDPVIPITMILKDRYENRLASLIAKLEEFIIN